MPTYKILSAEAFTAEASKWAARLAKGKVRLKAMQAAKADPRTSSAGKKTLAQAITMQAELIAKLERILALYETPQIKP